MEECVIVLLCILDGLRSNLLCERNLQGIRRQPWERPKVLRIQVIGCLLRGTRKGRLHEGIALSLYIASPIVVVGTSHAQSPQSASGDLLSNPPCMKLGSRLGSSCWISAGLPLLARIPLHSRHIARTNTHGHPSPTSY